MKKKKAKMQENAKHTLFDEQIIIDMKEMSMQLQQESMGMWLMNNSVILRSEQLQEQSNFLMSHFEQVTKNAISLWTIYYNVNYI